MPQNQSLASFAANKQMVDSSRLNQSKVEWKIFEKSKPVISIDDTTVAAQNFYYNFKFIVKENPGNYSFFKIDSIGYVKDTNVGNFRFAGKMNNVMSKDWLIGIIILILIILTWVRVQFKKVVLQMIKATFDNNLLSKLFREKNTLYLKVSTILNLVFILTLSLFVYEIIDFYKISPFGYKKFPLFLLISVSILAVYLTKYIVYKILGVVFQNQKLSSELLHCHYIFHKTTGLLLFALASSIPFVPDKLSFLFIKIGLIIYGVINVYRIFKGIQISVQSKLSIFYLILYLCTLEIIPIMVIYKLFISISMIK